MAEEKIIEVEKAPQPDAANAKAILKHGLDADEAMKAFVGQEGEQLVLDEETNKRLLRKIDLNIMPVATPLPRSGRNTG